MIRCYDTGVIKEIDGFMFEKYGKKLFIFLGCDVVYFILWIVPAIKIPAAAAVLTGLGLLVMTALSFVEVEDDTFDMITGDEKWFKITFMVGGVLALIGLILMMMFTKI